MCKPYILGTKILVIFVIWGRFAPLFFVSHFLWKERKKKTDIALRKAAYGPCALQYFTAKLSLLSLI